MTPTNNGRIFAPQIKTFYEWEALPPPDEQANEFSVKERHKNPTCPMPLLKQNGDGSVTVVYFIDVTPPDMQELADRYSLQYPPANPNAIVQTIHTGRQPDTASGWWPSRFKTTDNGTR